MKQMFIFSSNTHWTQLTVYTFIKYILKPPFSKIVSEVFPIMPNEVRESETIPLTRITQDPSDFQLHDGASSLQFTSLIFYRVQVRGLEFCVVFEVCVWIIARLEERCHMGPFGFTEDQSC